VLAQIYDFIVIGNINGDEYPLIFTGTLKNKGTPIVQINVPVAAVTQHLLAPP
jgi:hypothetical protein